MTTARRTEPLTGPVEDYLKAIYELERASAAANTSEIAQRLEIAPASVSGMIKRMSDQGLLSYEPYRGVRLTSEGRRAALRTLRRHRVLEAYLSIALGYAWDRVHDEAEQLEHAASDELIEKMALAIGEPLVDPHGAPIPSREGTIDERDYHSLDDVAAGYSARVVRVSDDDPGMLRYLAGLSIVPGAEVTLVSREPFGGPITVSIAETQTVIGPSLAKQVLVDPLPHADQPAH